MLHILKQRRRATKHSLQLELSLYLQEPSAGTCNGIVDFMVLMLLVFFASCVALFPEGPMRATHHLVPGFNETTFTSFFNASSRIYRRLGQSPLRGRQCYRNTDRRFSKPCMTATVHVPCQAQMIGLYPSYYAVEHCQLTLQLKEIREDFVIYTYLPSYVNSLLSSSVNITPYKLQLLLILHN